MLQTTLNRTSARQSYKHVAKHLVKRLFIINGFDINKLNMK